jgi:DNA-binding NarL/FixJ family response regulator
LLERERRFAVVGEAGTGAEAYREFCRLAPDVVVMDVSLPDVSGIETMRRMLARQRDARVLMFSMHEETIFPARALEAGARGYITKVSAPDVLIDAVRAVAAGTIYLSHDVAQALALRNVASDSGGVEALSAREFEILRLLVAGDTVAAIAERLGLGAKTVANHQSSIRSKLGAQSAAQLLAIAARHGLVAR